MSKYYAVSVSKIVDSVNTHVYAVNTQKGPHLSEGLYWLTEVYSVLEPPVCASYEELVFMDPAAVYDS